MKAKVSGTALICEVTAEPTHALCQSVGLWSLMYATETETAVTLIGCFRERATIMMSNKIFTLRKRRNYITFSFVFVKLLIVFFFVGSSGQFYEAMLNPHDLIFSACVLLVPFY